MTDEESLVRQLVKLHGWTTIRGSRHTKIFNPGGEWVATMSTSPKHGRNNARAFMNFRAQLRRGGSPL